MCKLSYYVFPVQRARGNSGPTEYNQFSLARLETETPQLDLWRQLDVRCYRSSLAVQLRRGKLSSGAFRDIGMNVALPEVDGRISRAVSLRQCKLETRYGN